MKMKSKKFLSILLALVMLFSILPVQSSAVTDEVAAQTEKTPIVPEGYYYYGESFTDENNRTIYYISAPDGGYGIAEGYWIDLYGNRVDNPVKLINYDVDREKTDLPSKYDARDDGLVTGVESQISGTCWAHAMIAALESNAIKRGFADNTLDLNEYHMIWNATDGYYEGVDDSANDGYIAADLTKMLSNGGNVSTAARALSNFSGAVTEKSIPVKSTSVNALVSEMGGSLSFDNKYDREITMAETVSIGSSESAIKKAILEYGGLYLAYSSYSPSYTHVGLTGEAVTTFYNATGKSDAGHAVELIGWDDDFPVENFAQAIRPEHNGAWLLKNSWGANYGSNNGFFWMSYEESSIYGITAVKAASPDEFEKVYMYDGSGYSRSIPASMAANVFTADTDITLTKFSVGNTVTRDYKLYIYKLAPDYKDPTDGKLIYTQRGNLRGQKYVDITGDVELNAGDVFSVVVGGLINCYAEGTGNSQRVFTSHAGESYYYDLKWHDCHETGNHNVCVRAVANTVKQSDSYEVSFVCPGHNKIVKYSQNGKVELPKTSGYTWVFTYNDMPFDGTNVTKNMTVEAHCYPTKGTQSKTCKCTTEYKCIYCSNDMKSSVTDHSFISTVHIPTENGAGYTKKTCLRCGYEELSNFKACIGGTISVSGNICCQYANGVLSFVGLGEMPDSEFDASPWKEYRNAGSIVINEGITTVGSYNFYGFGAKRISLPESLLAIGYSAFSDMENLTSVRIPDGVEKIGEYAFYGDAAIVSVSFGKNVESIGDYAFSYCRALKTGIIPDSVYYLGTGIYNYCSGMEKLVIEEGVTDVSVSVYECGRSDEYNLKEIVIPSTLRYSNGSFFKELNRGAKISVSSKNSYFKVVDGVVFYNDMKYICSYPQNKTEKFYNVPDSVVGFWNYAFYNNPYLECLDMSCDAVTLPQYCVYGNSALKNISLPEKLRTLNSWCIYSNGKIDKLYVPQTTSNISAYFISSYLGDYPTFYTDSDSAQIVSFAADNSAACVKDHVKHAFTNLLDGNAADCATASQRIMACDCGSIRQYSGVHCYDWVTDKPADCGTSGLKHRECVICGDKTDTGTVIPATGKHNYVDDPSNAETLATPATCTEPAVYCRICSVCGDINHSSTFTYGSPKSHSFTGEKRYNGNRTHSSKCIYCGAWGAGVGCNWEYTGVCDAGPDCMTSGSYYFRCTLCGGETTEPDYIYGAHRFKNPGYNDDGTHSGKCSVCGQNVTVPCDWKLVSSDAGKNCQKTGYDKYKCTVCGAKTEVPNSKYGSHMMIFGRCSVCGYESDSGIGGFFNTIRSFFDGVFAKIKSLFTISFTCDLTAVAENVSRIPETGRIIK